MGAACSPAGGGNGSVNLAGVQADGVSGIGEIGQGAFVSDLDGAAGCPEQAVIAVMAVRPLGG